MLTPACDRRQRNTRNGAYDSDVRDYYASSRSKILRGHMDSKMKHKAIQLSLDVHCLAACHAMVKAEMLEPAYRRFKDDSMVVNADTLLTGCK